MIIWSRWGIVVVLFVGLGVLLGFGLASATGMAQESGPINGMFVGIGLMISGAALWVFNRFVVGTYLDKPRAVSITEPLPAGAVDPQSGRKETHRTVPVLHPETGQPIYSSPVSRFFFIPIKYWAYLLPALGLVIFVVNVVAVSSGS